MMRSLAEAAGQGAQGALLQLQAAGLGCNLHAHAACRRYCMSTGRQVMSYSLAMGGRGWEGHAGLGGVHPLAAAAWCCTCL
jgi:hypothetical protein